MSIDHHHRNNPAARHRHGQRHHHPHRPEQHGPVDGGRLRGRHHRGAGRGRAQRGDVRTALLLLLAEEPMHGYQLMQAIAERTAGAWRPSPGAIYPTLSQLEDEGLIVTVAEGGRKLATLTDDGRAYLRTRSEVSGDPFAEITAQDAGGGELQDALEELRLPVRQLARGDSEQVQAARRVLAEARRSLYLILAGDPSPEKEAGQQ